MKTNSLIGRQGDNATC